MGLRKKPYSEDKKGGKRDDSKRSGGTPSSFGSKKPRVTRTEKSGYGSRNGDADGEKRSYKKPASGDRSSTGDARKSGRPTSPRGAYKGRNDEGEKRTTRPEFSDRPQRSTGSRTPYARKNDGDERRPSGPRSYGSGAGSDRRTSSSDGPRRTPTGRAPYTRKSDGDDRRPSGPRSYGAGSDRRTGSSDGPKRTPTGRAPYTRKSDGDDRGAANPPKGYGSEYGGEKRTSYRGGGESNKRAPYRTTNNRDGSLKRGPSRGGFSSSEDGAERGTRSDRDGFSNEGQRRGKTGRPYMVKGAKARDLKAKSDEMLESLTPEIVRLNRFISNAGICSRREADALISAGLVSVNGEIVTEMGYKVKPGDDVKYNKQRLSWEQKVYLLMNKPKDFITTSDDPDGRKIIMDLIKEPRLPRVYPVGRLDRNTTGVIMLTNDGELAQRLTHPKYNINKIYKAVLNKTFAAKDLQELGTNGVELEDGPIKPDVIGIPSASERNVVLVQIHSGRNRIIHRMFEALGYLVDKLDRIEFAGFDRKGLNRGEWRHMDEKEIKKLKKLVQLK